MDETHYSILHGLFKIGPIERWLPQPAKQPDLILNTFFMILVIGIFVAWATRNLTRVPETRLQGLLEATVERIATFFEDIIGEKGRPYIPFVGSFFIFVLALNMLGLIPGFQPPTADLNTTLGMALAGVVGAQAIGLRELGVRRYLRHFGGDPLWMAPLMAPLHIIGEVAKVLSLSLRLFGNIFGEEMVVLVMAGLSPILLIRNYEIPYIPVQFPMMLFSLFTGLIQAVVFSILVSIYIAMFLEEAE